MLYLSFGDEFAAIRPCAAVVARRRPSMRFRSMVLSTTATPIDMLASSIYRFFLFFLPAFCNLHALSLPSPFPFSLLAFVTFKSLDMHMH